MMARHWFAPSFGSTANERKRQAPNPTLPLLLQDVFGFFPGWATSPVFFLFRKTTISIEKTGCRRYVNTTLRDRH